MELYRRCLLVKELMIGMALMASAGLCSLCLLACSEVVMSFMNWCLVIGFFLLGVLTVWICMASTKKEKIRINEHGIECISPKGGQNWKLCWEEIESLRLERINRRPAVRIVPKNAFKFDPQSPNPWPNYYFELDKKAKEAIIRYSPYPVNKR